MDEEGSGMFCVGTRMGKRRDEAGREHHGSNSKAGLAARGTEGAKKQIGGKACDGELRGETIDSVRRFEREFGLKGRSRIRILGCVWV
jgi:hypothetical protein